jgi:hypothetical protein
LKNASDDKNVRDSDSKIKNWDFTTHNSENYYLMDISDGAVKWRDEYVTSKG